MVMRSQVPVHFPLLRQCGIQRFRTFISISHTVTGRLFTKLSEITGIVAGVNPVYFGRDPVDTQIPINLKIQIRMLDLLVETTIV